MWAALREWATVIVKLQDGRVTAGSGTILLCLEPPGTKSLRVRDNLHIALACEPRTLASQVALSGGVAPSIVEAQRARPLPAAHLLAKPDPK